MSPHRGFTEDSNPAELDDGFIRRCKLCLTTKVEEEEEQANNEATVGFGEVTWEWADSHPDVEVATGTPSTIAYSQIHADFPAHLSEPLLLHRAVRS